MDNVKIVSRILFYISRFFAAVYFASFLHSAIALATGWSLNLREDGKYFQVYFPFTETPFLNGDHNSAYIVWEFLTPLLLYGLFFLLLGNVFRVFFQPKLFTQKSIKHLKRFYLGNFIVPGLLVLIMSFIVDPEIDAIAVIVLHGIIGVFAYFLAAIFKKGLNLQREQDLII